MAVARLAGGGSDGLRYIHPLERSTELRHGAPSPRFLHIFHLRNNGSQLGAGRSAQLHRNESYDNADQRNPFACLTYIPQRFFVLLLDCL